MSSRISYIQKDIRRAYYLESSTLTDSVLAKTFAGMETKIEIVAEVGPLKVSDRPKYVGGTFYEGRISIPKIERKMPPLLSSQLSFSELELTVNNCDGRYNDLLIGGRDYRVFFGDSMELKVGLRDEAATFFPVFRGVVHSEGGTSRAAQTLTIRGRDEFERLNTANPLPRISRDEFLDAPQDVLGKVIPLVLGDWSEGVVFSDSPVAQAVDVDGVQVDVATKTCEVLGGGAVGYFVGGSYFVFAVGGNGRGNTFSPGAIEDVVIKRGNSFLSCNFGSIAVPVAGYWAVQVSSLVRASDGSPVPYSYNSGDVAVIRTKVSCMGSAAFDEADSNPINLARMFLVTCGRLAWANDFDASWDRLAAKAAPESSNFLWGIKARLWVGDESTNVLEHAIGLLRQVRCDLFVTKARKFAIATMHPEDVPQVAAMRHIEQVHILEETFSPGTDKSNFFTSADAAFCFSPALNGAALKTEKFRNDTAIAKIGREIAKTVDFPGLYRKADAELQVKEMIRFFSAAMEEITVSVAWLHLNVELGDFVALSFRVGSLVFDDVACQVRAISVDPTGAALELKLLSYGNFAVPNYTPPNQSKNLSSYSQVIS